MKIIKKDGFSYQILTDSEEKRIELVVEDVVYIIYEYVGCETDYAANRKRVTMLFIKDKEESIILTHLKRNYGEVEKVCNLPHDYSDDKFNLKFMNDRLCSRDFSLYLITSTDENHEKEAELIESNSNHVDEPQALDEQQKTLDTVAKNKRSRQWRNFFVIIGVILVFLLTFLLICGIIKNIDSANDVESSKEIPSTQPTIGIADLNADSKVTDEDFQLLFAYVNDLDTLPDELFDIADINQDGSVDTRDLSEFKRKFQ